MNASEARAFHWHLGKLSEVAATGGERADVGRLPEGAYTTLRVYPGGRVLRLDWHTRRLAESTGIPLRTATLRDGLAAALRATALDEARLRVTWAPPRLRIAVSPFVPLPAALYRDGARCASVDLHRENPAAKDARFIASAASAYASLPPGIHEGLLLGPRGEILEGLSSNVFAILEGVLRTEGAGALPGITRGLVLEAAAGLLPAMEEPVCLADLPRVSEIFLTSTSRGVLPVVEVDGAVVGDGAPGPVTREVGRRFDERVAREAVPLD